MNSHSLTMNFSGIGELQETFQKMVKKYPDLAGALLRQNAMKIRKDVANEVKKTKKSRGTREESLTKASSYEVSAVKGYGIFQSIEISAKSPHFHLVEHGHELLAWSRKGYITGFVQGKHMMENTVKKYKEIMLDTVENMVNELLKEEGLI